MRLPGGAGERPHLGIGRARDRSADGRAGDDRPRGRRGRNGARPSNSPAASTAMIGWGRMSDPREVSGACRRGPVQSTARATRRPLTSNVLTSRIRIRWAARVSARGFPLTCSGARGLQCGSRPRWVPCPGGRHARAVPAPCRGVMLALSLLAGSSPPLARDHHHAHGEGAVGRNTHRRSGHERSSDLGRGHVCCVVAVRGRDPSSRSRPRSSRVSAIPGSCSTFARPWIPPRPRPTP